MKKNYLILASLVIVLASIAILTKFLILPNYAEQQEQKKIAAFYDVDEKQIGQGKDADFLSMDSDEKEVKKL